MPSPLTMGVPKSLQDLVRRHWVQVVHPTTDTGYKPYGPGRLFLPAATCLCIDPQGTAATFWGTSTAHTTLTPNTTAPVAVNDNPLITKCLKMVNNGTADAPQTANITVVASTSYNSSIYVYAPTLGGNLTITDEVGHTFTLAALTAANAGWVRYSVQANTVAAEVTKSLKFTFAGGTASTVYVTGFNPVASAVLTPFFDGSHPDCVWSGAANASTSTRTASVLTLAGAGYLGDDGVGTVACRFTPLFDSNYAADAGFVMACPANRWYAGWDATKGWATKEYDGTNFPKCQGAAAFTAGSSHSLVFRHSGTKLDTTYDGTAVAQANDTATISGIAAAGLDIGSFRTVSANTRAMGYLGPVAICPARITDAETVLLDAGLTAGWGGIDLAKFFRDRNYSGTLILPLADNSTGYVLR